MSSLAPDGWLPETLHKHYQQRLEAAAVLYQEQTEHQSLIIIENQRFGRVLALDGAIQVTERDEYVYHEMLVHVPFMAHGAVREALVIGGGDGGVVRRCLLHAGLERVTLVEIDRAVVDLCQRFMPTIADGALDDPRCELVIADGIRYVAETDRRFDVIIIDSTDPVGPAEGLFTQDFYADCRRCLTPGGILVTQNGVPFLQPQELATGYDRLKSVFADAWMYQCVVPTYSGGIMTLGWGCDDPDKRALDATDIARRWQQAGIEKTQYYTPELHAASFALPRFILDIMGV